MGIVTKKGDKGKTSLYFGGMVSKDHPRVELCGALDELSSFLGFAKSLLRDKQGRAWIEGVQKDLVTIAAEAATAPGFLVRLKKRVQKEDVGRLERQIATLESRSKRKNFCFSIPGSCLVSSCLDVARTIARRAERRAVSLLRKRQIANKDVLAYLNRLSDFLYLLARKSENVKA
ncbi:ATP:cob(I)alamin adenosyltransferase [Candidatus Velamenicoccus archaeovorus]|uniref:Corrinoid adenosyltransferase n=1 Tax=Velamenicoccus archaeovorus TaxID=1930593 RepID=A0A410P5S4_VELA1|nr:cob(I)yrinic acid a,c-diamide adenosyltransferase [Candidatus Velamenicoccus archaeovorus]QAT17442.1 ATP:cob(I)alamin adenosyltransferase [Candidatus Velamenicoccus archaeovorus]